MEKLKKRSLLSIYRRPLPLALSVDEEGRLPPVNVHNPLTWIYVLYQIASIYVQTPPQAHVPLVAVDATACGDSVVFQVRHESDMEKLWREGFFGKGTLSRSDPSWRQRVLRRLNLDSGSSSEISNEEVTRVRREERKRFKELRSQAQKFETMERHDKLTDEDRAAWEQIKLQLADTKTTKQDFKVQSDQPGELRKEDAELIDVDTKQLKENLEFLQLQNVELFFLAWALDVVKVTSRFTTPDGGWNQADCPLSLSEVFTKCCRGKPQPENKFILDYVVYHHFRSHGWCVRSGIKFGCDFLLYKRGPPFMHAEYAVLVIPNNGRKWKDWEDVMAVSRVVGGVRKTLVMVFVDIPSVDEFNTVYSDNMDRDQMWHMFQLYKVTEVISKRWLPSRTRD